MNIAPQRGLSRLLSNKPEHMFILTASDPKAINQVVLDVIYVSWESIK